MWVPITAVALAPDDVQRAVADDGRGREKAPLQSRCDLAASRGGSVRPCVAGRLCVPKRQRRDLGSSSSPSRRATRFSEIASTRESAHRDVAPTSACSGRGTAERWKQCSAGAHELGSTTTARSRVRRRLPPRLTIHYVTRHRLRVDPVLESITRSHTLVSSRWAAGAHAETVISSRGICERLYVTTTGATLDGGIRAMSRRATDSRRGDVGHRGEPDGLGLPTQDNASR